MGNFKSFLISHIGLLFLAIRARSYDNCVVLSCAHNYRMEWSISGSDIDIRLSGNSSGYVAVGWSLGIPNPMISGGSGKGNSSSSSALLLTLFQLHPF